MDEAAQLIFTVADRSYFALLKKRIHALAVEIGFNEERTGKVDIIVAELVTNLVKHAGGGQLIVKKIKDQHNGDGIELISIDNGPGISDLKKMMQDGISTTNTLGHGLGAIQRLSGKCEIYSQKGWGSIILSRIYKLEKDNFKKQLPVEISSLVLPKPGEEVCGDGFFYKQTKEKLKIFLGDGLGHGPEAALAVNTAINEFRHNAEEKPSDVIRTLHQSIRKTRGIVACIAVFSFKDKLWRICGVGNIATRISSYVSAKNYVAHNGIIGHNIPNTMKDQEIPYEPGQNIILASDGIKTKWDLLKYPGIIKSDLSILTAALYKDHTRNSDDASIAVAKINI